MNEAGPIFPGIVEGVQPLLKSATAVSCRQGRQATGVTSHASPIAGWIDFRPFVEVSPDDVKINQALQNATVAGADLLKVTALEALIQRGAITNEGINLLLTILADGDADIRSQAASSLRNCADSEWTQQCVQGLSELLSDQDSSVVAMAASTLGDFGSHAATVRVDLQRLAVEQTDPHVLEAVSVALQRILNSHPRESAVALPPVLDSTQDHR